MSTIRPATMKWMLIPAVTALVLSACSPSISVTASSATTTTRAAELALGTLSLEGTDQAVDAAAAAQLLPMWELLSDLRTSSTAAAEELAATVEAIEAAMTPEQLAAIEAMELSAAEDSSGGLPREAPSGTESDGGTAQAGAVAMDPSPGGDPGAAMGGGMPMDGGMPPGGGPSPSQASRTTGGNSSSGMYRDVIALLQNKMQD